MKYIVSILTKLEDMLPHFELVKQLQPELKKEHYEKNLPEMIACNYRMVVLIENNKIIALSGIWVATKMYCGKYIEMDNVVVDEKHRGKGIGKLLTDEIIRIGQGEGCVVAMLDAYLENEEAHGFYEREGFVKKGFHFIKKIHLK
ncbi:MAG: GNAT family N-acetyltransferase [Flavobacteriales bacterium]